MIYLFVSAAAAAAAVCIWLIVRRRPHALFVLTYEKIGRAPAGSRLKYEWTSPNQLEKMLLFLKKHGFSSIPLSSLQANEKLPAKPVLLAFVGGYQSFMAEVFPLLQKYHMQAALFVPPALLGQYNAWQDPHVEPWQNILTINEIKTLAKSGLISLGAMTLSGEDLSLLSAEERAFLLSESVFRLHKLTGVAVNGFSLYPAQVKHEEQSAALLPAEFTLPVLTGIKGLNPRRRPQLIKTLFPARCPLAVRFSLWKHR